MQEMSADKLALLCHIGGDFVQDEGKIVHKGGTVRLVYVERKIGYSELLKKVGGLSKQLTLPITIKYKHPDIEFGSPFLSPLVTIENADDLSNMVEVFPDAKPTIPVYISARGSSSYTSPIPSSKSDKSIAPAAIPAEAIQKNASSPGASRGTSSNKRKRKGTLTSSQVKKKSAKQSDGSVQTIKATARKRVARKTKAPISEREIVISDGPSATAYESTDEEVDVSSSLLSGETNSNRNKGRRVTRSMSRRTKKASSASGKEIVSSTNEPKESNMVVIEKSSGEESILKQGQEFESVVAFRKALSEAAIAENFVYKKVKNESKRFTAKCVFEECKWRIHASKLKGVATFQIKTYNPVHTCARNELGENDPNVKAHWVSRFILNRIKDKSDYRPKDLTAEIYQNFGVTVSYSRAWRGRKWARKLIEGSSEESWEALPAYRREAEKTNPKSVFCLQCDAEDHFQRLFVALNAPIRGFILGCRPLLIFKATNILGRYSLVLLSAMAVDANGEAFPISYAIVESESVDSWGWFMLWVRQALEGELGDSLRTTPWLTVISEEKDSLVETVATSFPGAYHAFCVSHLADRIPFKDDEVRNYIFSAARAYTRDDYEHYINEIRKINIRGHEWIMSNLNPKNWATSYFEGQRYNILTSNVGENFTSWITELVNVPIITVIQQLHSRLVTHFAQQCEVGKQLESVLAPKPEVFLQEKRKEALGYRVEYSVAVERVVVDSNGSSFFVNLSQWTCTCCEWQVQGLPCSHALAVIQLEGLDAYQYCQQWFTSAKFKAAYSGEINPVRDSSEWSYEDLTTVKPPCVDKTRRGRYKVRLSKKVKLKDYLHCSVCQASGHNIRTCPVKQNDVLSLPIESS